MIWNAISSIDKPIFPFMRRKLFRNEWSRADRVAVLCESNYPQDTNGWLRFNFIAPNIICIHQWEPTASPIWYTHIHRSRFGIGVCICSWGDKHTARSVYQGLVSYSTLNIYHVHVDVYLWILNMHLNMLKFKENYQDIQSSIDPLLNLQEYSMEIWRIS